MMQDMRLVSRSLCAGAAVVAVGIGTAAAAPAPVNSGVRGLVLYGPTCPVQRAGQTCERPYQATIVFRREPSRRIVARGHSGADGRFTVHLRAGRYLVAPRNGVPYPRAQSQTVSVSSHHFTAVTIHFDSGIR
jgi:hypothetical protein